MMWAVLYKRLFFIFCLFFLGVGLFSFAQAQGVLDGETYQTNPKDRPVTVSATVIPPDPPPYPVLIAPANNAILTSGVVVFEWRQPPGHPAALDRYELYLNGTMKFGQIHITNQETDDYVLTVTNGNEYRLALKQDKWLPDGSYTWKIRVIDVNDRGSDSTTWSFLIDSTPPNILITEVDGDDTAISAADPTTVPTEPIVVTSSGPKIVGHTEAGSEVQLTVTFPDGSTARYRTTADGNGNFSFMIEGLKADQVVTLTFTSIDLAGLSRVLDGVRLIYQPKKIVVTLPPIFPQPITLTIYVWQPGIPSTFISALRDLPPPFGPLITQVTEPQQPTKLIEVPVFPVGSYALAWLFLILGYVIAVFVLTRNSLKFFLPYFMSFCRFWIFGSKGKYRWVEGAHLVPLAFYGFTSSWLDEKKRLRTEYLVSTPLGTWQVPFVDGRMINLHSEHTLYPFPPAKSVVREMAEGVVLTQEGLAFRATQPSEKTDVALLVNETEKVIALTAPIQRPGWPPILSFLPRVILVLTLLCAFWILWHAKTWLTILILLVTLWVLVRDIQVGLRKRLEVYVS